MKKKIIQIIKKHHEKNKRYVPWEKMWDSAVDEILKVVEEKHKNINRRVIYIKKNIEENKKK